MSTSGPSVWAIQDGLLKDRKESLAGLLEGARSKMMLSEQCVEIRAVRAGQFGCFALVKSRNHLVSGGL